MYDKYLALLNSRQLHDISHTPVVVILCGISTAASSKSSTNYDDDDDDDDDDNNNQWVDLHTESESVEYVTNVIKKKQEKTFVLIDVAKHPDKNVTQKEAEKKISTSV
jgi:hypothetical protein